MHYLDVAATTPVNKEVAKTISDTMEHYFANPSSLYLPGMEAETLIHNSRQTLAQALGCEANEVVFTASGTEGNNLAIWGTSLARKTWGNHIVVSGYEHSSVRNPVLELAKREGFSVTEIAPEPSGNLDIRKMVEAVNSKTVLVCAMQVNNETGAITDIAALSQEVKNKNRRCAVHVDGVQGFTKLQRSMELSSTMVDSYAVSGHKISAPKGIGALYLRKGLHLLPLMQGGGQQEGRRPGTENTPYIAGLAKAAQLRMENFSQDKEQVNSLAAYLLENLLEMNGVTIHSPQNGYKGILNIGMPGVYSHHMVNFLQDRQIYVSGGSACAKGKASHTLESMGIPTENAKRALRISVDGTTSMESARQFICAFRQGLSQLG